MNFITDKITKGGKGILPCAEILNCNILDPSQIDKNKINKGPNMDPCGTPYLTFIHSDELSANCTYCCLLR